MEESLYDEMFRLESTHWWFVAKRRIVLSLLAKFVPPSPDQPPPRVCDVGCGCGMTLWELGRLGYDAVGIDASERALSYCASRGVWAIKGSLSEGLNLPPASARAVLMLDVLEHLEDDQAALAMAMDLLEPRGILIATVPAYPWLWTRRDEYHHHKRRYNRGAWRRMVSSMASRCGASPLMISHFNTYLFPLMAVGRLTRKVLPSGQPGDLSIPPAGLNGLLRSVFASERLLLSHGLSLPFGLSLLAVVQKHGSLGDAHG